MAEHWRPVPLPEGEERAFARAVAHGFYRDPDDEPPRWLPLVQADDYRAWTVREDGGIVGTYGAFSMTLSVPGGRSVACAGVTAVTVAQTHRRRGVLRAMMDAGLEEAARRGEPVAALFASESAIYGRFGFGATAPTVTHHVDRGAAFRDPVDATLVRGASPQEALAAWPGLFETVRASRGGCVSRDPELWRLTLVDDPPSGREGASARHLVHVPGRGYAAYRVTPSHDHALPTGRVRVQELMATDAEAEAALWQHVCDLDLTSRVEAWYRPPDDALPHLLVDPLRARSRVGPPLQVRLLDLAAAFEARTYGAEGAVTLAVADPFRDQTGSYRIEAFTDGATVRAVSGEPDLSMPVDVAASVWLGGVRAVALRDARRLVEHVDGAAARLDRLTAVDRLPWTPFDF